MRLDVEVVTKGMWGISMYIKVVSAGPSFVLCDVLYEQGSEVPSKTEISDDCAEIALQRVKILA